MTHLDVLHMPLPALVLACGVAVFFANRRLAQVSRKALAVEELDTTGGVAVKRMLRDYGVSCKIERTEGVFDDRFVPGAQTIFLTELSYASPSILPLSLALMQAGAAVRFNEHPLPRLASSILVFAGRFLALIATIAIPFAVAFPEVFFAVLVAYCIAFACNLVSVISEQKIANTVSRWARDAALLNPEQLDEMDRILQAQALSGLASTFAPFGIAAGLIRDLFSPIEDPRDASSARSDT